MEPLVRMEELVRMEDLDPTLSGVLEDLWILSMDTAEPWDIRPGLEHREVDRWIGGRMHRWMDA